MPLIKLALVTTRLVINSLVAFVKVLLPPCPRRELATSMKPLRLVFSNGVLKVGRRVGMQRALLPAEVRFSDQQEYTTRGKGIPVLPAF